MISRICLLYLILHIVLSIIKPPVIKAEFIKYYKNPILSPDILNIWENRNVYGPSIIWSGLNGEIWYSSSNNSSNRSIGYSTITINNIEDLITQKYPGNPILNSSFVNLGDSGVDDPFVITELINTNIVYKMWFTRTFGPPNYTFKLYYTESSNGISWNPPVQLDLIYPPLSGINSAVGPAVVFNPILGKYQLWFGARRFSNWLIGYAESINGINWTNVIIPVLEPEISWEGGDINSPFVFIKDGLYYMFYDGGSKLFYANSLDGKHWIKNKNSYILEPSSSNPTAFDFGRVMRPFLVENNSKYYLFYNGSGQTGEHIGVAISDTLPPSTINTPTPSPTSTPTPTPSPTIDPDSPIVLLPGLGSTWNPLSVLSCDINSTGTWNIAPYVHEYDRLIKTLTENAGKNPDEDFFVYGYDWRQGLEKQADNLNDYLANTVLFFNPGKKVILFGHSLGGLVIRSYLTEFGNSHVARAITAGSPHQGTVLAYPIWEKGEFWVDDMVMKIAVNKLVEYCRLVSGLNRGRPQSKREVVQKTIPSIRDLLPVFDYIQNKNHNPALMPYLDMHHKNKWLIDNSDTSYLDQTDFNTMSGTGFSTLNLLNVSDPSQNNINNGDWIDGKPLANGKEYSEEGDGTILNLSSRISGVPDSTINSDHGDLVSSTEGIAKIVELLDLPGVLPAAIQPLPEKTSSNILTITSDQTAILKLTRPKTKLEETRENSITLYDPDPGNYLLKIIPKITAKGIILVQKVSRNKEDIFSYIEVNLVKDTPIEYTFHYSPSSDLKLIPNP